MSSSFFGYPLRVLCLSFVFAQLATPSLQAEDPLNVLFYGNSFTLGSGSSRSVPHLFRSIALAAGHSRPRATDGAVSGKNFAFHLARNFHVINTGLPAAEDWDFVVMQNFSTAPTRLGDLNRHRSDSVRLYQKVADRSPDVTPVLFETWARAPGHAFYDPATLEFPGGPAQMQQELREGYRLAAMDIDTAAGPDTTRIAPIGDAWEDLDWRVRGAPLHFTDLYHAANPGTLLTALTIYATIYQDDTADIDLTDILADLRLRPSYGSILTKAADHAVFGVPEPSAVVLLLFASLLLLAAGRRNGVCRCV